MADFTNRIESHFESGCGHCGECRWWQTDANAEAGRDRVGLCLHEELVHFELEVACDCGCNRFEADRALMSGTAGERGMGI